MPNAWTGRPPNRKRASGPNVHVAAYIHPALRRKLEEEMKATGRTLSEQVGAAIEAGMDRGARGERRTPFKERVAELMKQGNREAKARAIAEQERGW